MRDEVQQNSIKTTDDPATVDVDVQDPLPETNWFWRRVYTFVLSLVSVAFIRYGIEALYALRDGASIYKITRYMIGVHVLLITFYMLAPSAEQLVKLVQAAKLLQAGVPMSRRATVQGPQGRRTEVETTAGRADPRINRDEPTGRPRPPQAQPRDEEDFAPRSRRHD